LTKASLTFLLLYYDLFLFIYYKNKDIKMVLQGMKAIWRLLNSG